VGYLEEYKKNCNQKDVEAKIPCPFFFFFFVLGCAPRSNNGVVKVLWKWARGRKSRTLGSYLTSGRNARDRKGQAKLGPGWTY
jgi:hypothetical protein